jgi:hypothetical protein
MSNAIHKNWTGGNVFLTGRNEYNHQRKVKAHLVLIVIGISRKGSEVQSVHFDGFTGESRNFCNHESDSVVGKRGIAGRGIYTKRGRGVGNVVGVRFQRGNVVVMMNRKGRACRICGDTFALGESKKTESAEAGHDEGQKDAFGWCSYCKYVPRTAAAKSREAIQCARLKCCLNSGPKKMDL